jgi:hypothetical protein
MYEWPPVDEDGDGNSDPQQWGNQLCHATRESQESGKNHFPHPKIRFRMPVLTRILTVKQTQLKWDSLGVGDDEKGSDSVEKTVQRRDNDQCIEFRGGYFNLGVPSNNRHAAR